MKINVQSGEPREDRRPLSLRCHICRQIGVFPPFPKVADLLVNRDVSNVPTVWLGQRHCPAPGCRAHVFVAFESNGSVLASYPPESIDFDATDIPTTVTEALEEAIKCHSMQCYKAAAIMVRKTLEALCKERGADGASLQARIADLGTKVVLPQELLEGLDDLRLLGNDAAHIESRVYDDVGQDEVEIAMDVAKEVLKAVYQYKSLVERLQGLKQKKSAAP